MRPAKGGPVGAPILRNYNSSSPGHASILSLDNLWRSKGQFCSGRPWQYVWAAYLTAVKAQPYPPRTGQASPDPEADWTRRGQDGHFGYKVHFTVARVIGILKRH